VSMDIDEERVPKLVLYGGTNLVWIEF
jgi:hypothetical protein